MNKSDKKTEKQIVKALNTACDSLMGDVEGFCWLTHFVDYANVSQSLRIVVVFDTDQALSDADASGLRKTISALVVKQLENHAIVIVDSEKTIHFDTEQQGADVNNTHWCRTCSSRRDD